MLQQIEAEDVEVRKFIHNIPGFQVSYCQISELSSEEGLLRTIQFMPKTYQNGFYFLHKVTNPSNSSKLIIFQIRYINNYKNATENRRMTFLLISGKREELSNNS